MTDRTVRTLLARTDVSCAVDVVSGEQLMATAAQVQHNTLLINWAFFFFFFSSSSQCALCFPDVNECQESNPCNQHCLNTIGSYRCACEPGFQLRNRRCIGETDTQPDFHINVALGTPNAARSKANLHSNIKLHQKLLIYHCWCVLAKSSSSFFCLSPQI